MLALWNCFDSLKKKQLQQFPPRACTERRLTAEGGRPNPPCRVRPGTPVGQWVPPWVPPWEPPGRGNRPGEGGGTRPVLVAVDCGREPFLLTVPGYVLIKTTPTRT